MSDPFARPSEAYAWLDGQVNYERTLGSVAYDSQTFALEGFRQRLRALGDPHRALRAVHIAGTRGKGSAALALEALLRACGLRTAVYTSPHLHEYRERIRLDGAWVSGAMFTEILGRIARLAPPEPPEAPPAGDGRAFKTVFETLTALFFLIARESAVDWAIVETGLGGRLDATNVLGPGPVLLTRIGLEHTHLLGDTIEAIAAEKAAILKAGGWGVAGAQDAGGGAEAIYRGRAAAVGARLDHAPALCPLRRFEPTSEGSRLEILFEGRPLKLELAMYGDFQVENLQNALALFSRLRAERLIPLIPDGAIVAALEGLRLPGRMERVCVAPAVFADGGHCPTAAAALARTMRDHFGEAPAGLLVGMMQEKDHEGFFRALAEWPGWQWVWCYPPRSPRALDAPSLAAVARRHFHNTRVFQNLDQALESIERLTDKRLRIVATGSLYSIARLEEWGVHHGPHGVQTKVTQAQAEPDASH